MTLKQAKRFLGQANFKYALTCSIGKLQGLVEHPHGILTGASDAYEAILRYRLRTEVVRARKAS